MKKLLNQKILIELIDVSAGTQQRPLSVETVARYKGLMDEKVEFPPIEVVYNGKDTYWCWDGFHRLAALNGLNCEHIRANVELGDLRRAKWLSYSANKDHGLPRQEFVISNIIDEMLKDQEWGQWPVRKIARHVGCSFSYVQKRKTALFGEKQCTPVHKMESETPHSTTKDIPIEARQSQPEQEPCDNPIKDDVGNDIPERLSDRFLSRSIIQDMIEQLDKIKNQVINNDTMTFALLNPTGFQADLANLRNRLKSAIPYAICPYCGGKECNACHNSGFVNKETFEVSPKKELTTP